MDAQIDEMPVASLDSRYGVHRSQVYNRLEAIKKRRDDRPSQLDTVNAVGHRVRRLVEDHDAGVDAVERAAHVVGVVTKGQHRLIGT